MHRHNQEIDRTWLRLVAYIQWLTLHAPKCACLFYQINSTSWFPALGTYNHGS